MDDERTGFRRRAEAGETAEWDETAGQDEAENADENNETGEAEGGGEPSPYSFSELYTLYATDVLRVCHFYLNDRQKAEDVCQDVFVRLLTTNPQLQAGKEKSWLLKVALNRCKDLWRSAWLKRVVLGSPAFEMIPAPDDFSRMEERQTVMDAVNSLPPVFKEVVLLHYYQGYGIAEIAGMLNLPEGTISSRLNRARTRLGKALGGTGDTMEGDDAK